MPPDGESAFVKHVRPNSPLVDQVREGDIVVAVDDVDTSRFSHADLTNLLIEKQRVEAEEAQRLVAFTRNASAGVACCEARFGAAVEHYRQVLKLEASGAADGLGLRLDPLQRLHALHNLRLALDAADEAAAKKTSSVAVSRALRDDTLNRDAETERQKYLASRAGGVFSGVFGDVFEREIERFGLVRNRKRRLLDVRGRHDARPVRPARRRGRHLLPRPAAEDGRSSAAFFERG